MKNHAQSLAVMVATVALFVVGCGSGPILPTPTALPPAPALTATPYSSALAEAVVKEWIAAYTTKNTDQLLSLYSEDARFMDTGDPAFRQSGPMAVKSVSEMLRMFLTSPYFKMEVISYFVSPDGRSAVVESSFSYVGNTGGSATSPAAAVLSIENGKIASETWYYDGSQFY